MSNPTLATSNAAKVNYLVPAGGGKKQITLLGEKVVEALPNREMVKKVIAEGGLRRRRKPGRKKAAAKKA